MSAPEKDPQSHYLHPGNLFAHRTPHVVTTILGSCVAVCLWDPVLKAGGINHYLLSLWNGEGLALPKYGNIAIKNLLDKMEGLGSNKRSLQAKVFGGAAMHQNSNGLMNVGKRNIVVAEDILAREGIPTVSSDTAGFNGRRLLFYTETGLVRMRYIKKSTPGK